MSRRSRTIPRRAKAARRTPHDVVVDVDDPLTCGRCHLLRKHGIHDPATVAAYNAEITAAAAAVARRYEPHAQD